MSNKLFNELKELYQQNAKAAEFERLYPEASNEEKLPHKKAQHETYEAIQVKFESFIEALSELPEAERQPLAMQAMSYTNAKPVSPAWKRRLQ
jgi:DNA-directed RNA polymerase specialized sigma24 family protein